MNGRKIILNEKSLGVVDVVVDDDDDDSERSEVDLSFQKLAYRIVPFLRHVEDDETYCNVGCG